MKIIGFGCKQQPLPNGDKGWAPPIDDKNILIVEMTQKEYNRMTALYIQWKDQQIRVPEVEHGECEPITSDRIFETLKENNIEPVIQKAIKNEMQEQQDGHEFVPIFNEMDENHKDAKDHLDSILKAAMMNTDKPEEIQKSGRYLLKKLFSLEAAKIVLHYTITSRCHIKQAYEEGWINKAQYESLDKEVAELDKKKSNHK